MLSKRRASKYNYYYCDTTSTNPQNGAKKNSGDRYIENVTILHEVILSETIVLSDGQLIELPTR
ncbi:hypothetical protein NSTC731_03588 [Nostoc sp. DSM 114167]